jgi:formylglycine-generating enzyme required for sulfatase activity
LEEVTFGRLYVNTEPKGAKVKILNISPKFYQGIELDPGRYHIEVSAKGYEAKRQWIEVAAGEREECDIRLTRLLGRLYVNTEPKGASVKILDINSEFYQGIELDPGRYHVEVSTKDYETKRQWSEVVAGEREECDMRLTRLLGMLYVNTEPKGASVRILGINSEFHYHIEVSTSGYKTVKKWVEIAGGESKKVNIGLGRAKIITNSLGMKFVYIKPGSFMMGSPSGESGRYNDEKRHEVTLTNGFYMQTTEVTQGQWRKIMGNNPSCFKNCGDDCPVECVLWNNAQEFIRKLNQKEGTNKYRLPTEAEWECACRAGSETRFCFGNSDSQLGRYAWYGGHSGGKPHAVGGKRPNAWGLYDMHGNVSEWCQDWKGEYPSGHVTDPTGPSDVSWWSRFQVMRGGSWYNDARYCRSAFRKYGLPGCRDCYLGFRLLRTQ